MGEVSKYRITHWPCFIELGDIELYRSRICNSCLPFAVSLTGFGSGRVGGSVIFSGMDSSYWRSSARSSLSTCSRVMLFSLQEHRRRVWLLRIGLVGAAQGQG